MNGIEEYLPKALEMEAAFLKSRNPNEIYSFSKDMSRSDEAVIVPSEIMFRNQEKILIKAPVSPYLLKKFGIPLSFPPAFPAPQNRKPFFHRHDFFEFNYVYRGRVENRIESEIIFQETGQFILMNPYAAHRAAIAEPDTVYFNILVNRVWAEEIFSVLLSFHEKIFNFFLDSVYGLNHISPYIIFENTPEINLQICELIKEYYEDAPYSQQMLFSKLFELFILLSRQSNSASQKRSLEFVESRISTELFSYLKLNYANVTLPQAAEHFGYTATYLSRLIKKQTGKYFSEIIQDRKSVV